LEYGRKLRRVVIAEENRVPRQWYALRTSPHGPDDCRKRAVLRRDRLYARIQMAEHPRAKRRSVAAMHDLRRVQHFAVGKHGIEAAGARDDGLSRNAAPHSDALGDGKS